MLEFCFFKAATFEKMMKNLRLEIANLRRSLEESRYVFWSFNIINWLRVVEQTNVVVGFLNIV